MKKTMILALVALLAMGCVKESVENEAPNSKDKVEMTFRMGGDFTFSTQGFTRSLTADGKDMTDVWVLDYMGATLMQQVHQVSTDEDFGTPTMTLDLGEHHLYFVASRGGDPTLDTSAKTIIWGTVRDTFCKDLALTVTASSSGSTAVVLDRVVTKLKLTVTDEVPSGCVSVTMVPDTWYDGLNYTNGNPVASSGTTFNISVPSSYIGTTGELMLNYFGFSGTTEWTTNISLTAKNEENEVVGSALIADAPFLRNRVTECSGPLFSGGGAVSLSLNPEWLDAASHTW